MWVGYMVKGVVWCGNGGLWAILGWVGVAEPHPCPSVPLCLGGENVFPCASVALWCVSMMPHAERGGTRV